MAKESVIVGIIAGVRPADTTPQAQQDPQLIIDRLRAIAQEITKLQRRWDSVQKRIDQQNNQPWTEKIKLQASVTEGDRLLLMIAQLEKAKAALIVDKAS